MSANLLRFPKPTAAGKLKRAPQPQPVRRPAIGDTVNIMDYLDFGNPNNMLVITNGESMEVAGIKANDLLLVNRSLKPGPDDYVVVVEDGVHVIRKAPHASHLRIVGAEAPDEAGFVGVITFNISAFRGSDLQRAWAAR